MIIDREAKDLELKKHVGSIHCSNTLSLLQRKISNVLLYHAYHELLEKEEHEISIKNLCVLIGYSSHDYDSIKKALKALISTVLEWNLLEDQKGVTEDWNASSILASVGIRGGICTYAYSNRLKKLLFMPEIYGRINITIQSRFKSNYALALYENCIRYQNLPYTRWFALATFRKLMGVPDHKYGIFRDFKRRVLDKSVEEVNSYSDISVEPEIEREGFKVNRIRFKLNARRIPSDLIISPVRTASTNDELLHELTTAFGFKVLAATKLLRDYDPNFIKEKMALIMASHAYTHNRVQNLTAYLKSALKENYSAPPSSKGSGISNTLARAKEQEMLKKQYSDYIAATIDNVYESLDSVSQALLHKEFASYLQNNNNTFVLDKFQDKGLNNRIVKSLFRTFMRENTNELLPPLENFEQYVTKRCEESHEPS